MNPNDRFCTRIRLAALFVSLIAAAPTFAADANDASDVCSLSANPCRITAKYDIVSGSTLDFGTRAVIVENNGQLDFGSGSAIVLSGHFSTTLAGTYARLIVRGNTGNGNTGGNAVIIARSWCSGNAAVPCLGNDDCLPAAGVCVLSGGDITLGDDVIGSGNPGGTLKLVAFGDVIVSKPIDLSKGGNSPGSAVGGYLDVETKVGSVVVGDTVTVDGGESVSGGRVFIDAAQDLTVNAAIEAAGGEDGGGTVSLQADRDVRINAGINVRSAGSSGTGGAIDVNAGRDLVVTGASSTNQTVLNSMGHRNDAEAESGDGGDQEYRARGAVNFGQHVWLRASGPDQPSPEAEGGSVLIAGCSLTLQGGADLRSNGKHGGHVELSGESSVTISSTASVQATGKPDGTPGVIEVHVKGTGTCSNDGSVKCLSNADCTIGCSTGTCNNNNFNIGSGNQFDPEETLVNDPTIRLCN